MPFSNPTLIPYLTVAGATRAFTGGRRSPYTAGNRCQADSVGAATVYGVNHPGYLATTRVLRLTKAANAAYASNVSTFTVPSGTVSAPVTVAASITALNYLAAIAMINGVLLERKGTDFTLDANGQFKVASATTIDIYDGGGTYLKGAAAVEIIIPDTALITQFAGGAFTASREYEIAMTDFVTTGVAAVNLSPLVVNG